MVSPNRNFLFGCPCSSFLEIERGVHQALGDGVPVSAGEVFAPGQQPGEHVIGAGENHHIIGHGAAFQCYNRRMGKKDKLYQRVRNNQNNVRFQDFCTLMEYFAFVLVRVRGSHHLYQHPDIDEVMNVQPRKDGLAKAYQVRQFLKLVEAHELQFEDADDGE